MKRTLLLALFALLTLGISAQSRVTDLGASLHIGGQDTNIAGFGVKLRHTFNTPIRMEANANLLFANSLLIEDFNVNVHRPFSLTRRTTLYPLLGVNLSLWDWQLDGGNSGPDVHAGLNVGGGIEYQFAPRWSVGFELKYLFIKKDNLPFGSLGIAYRL